MPTARFVVFATVTLSAALVTGDGIAQTAVPKTKKVELVDEIHGTKVADPYRWLEDDVRTSSRVAEWVRGQNTVTFDYLAKIPARETIRRRITDLWNYEKLSAPFRAGSRYFLFKNDGLQNQDVLYTMTSLDGEPKVVLDPNTWSKDGTVALSGLSVSNDGLHVAYAIAEAGSDWKTWRVMNVDSGRILDDELKWTKWGTIAWTDDGRGFFYSRFPAPEKGAAFQSLNLDMKLYYHRLRTPQSKDVPVYWRPDQPRWGYFATVSDDGRYLVITVAVGTDDRYRILVKDLAEPYAMPAAVIDNFDHEWDFIGNDETDFYFKTNLDAPRGRIVALDIRQPDESKVRELVAETENTLQSVNLVAGSFICTYMKDARSQVRIHRLNGKLLREVDLPGIGAVGGFGGRRKDTQTFYSFSSFTTPPSTYHYDLFTGESTLLRRAKVDFDPKDYEVKQVFYGSKDGTRVPMFIAHKKGLRLDGNNPTLLYGYGGFNISLLPRFSVSRLAWMEMGGVFVQANIRGGGEYGEKWHKAGTKLQKQNVFDDFIAAAEWLVANDYTRPERLAIQGGSNGGLLVGACMTQRPDLFGACLPAVGVMDMLRFHKFTAGRYWVDDYGSADDPEEFKALLAYSPYHNLKPGTKYPATLVTTADTDDRVVPGHSFKFTAALQEAQAGKAPTLIRIETRAGHGAGKPTSKLIEEIADQWAFLVKNLGIKGNQ